MAADVCPARPATPLRYIDVFDGSPDELADLIPDAGDDHSGFWKLGYVYDAGRIVTIRCKYTGGSTLDVKLAKRVATCRYKVDARHALRIDCR